MIAVGLYVSWIKASAGGRAPTWPHYTAGVTRNSICVVVRQKDIVPPSECNKPGTLLREIASSASQFRAFWRGLGQDASTLPIAALRDFSATEGSYAECGTVKELVQI